MQHSVPRSCALVLLKKLCKNCLHPKKLIQSKLCTLNLDRPFLHCHSLYIRTVGSLNFLSFFELMSDSLTTILVEPHQCLSQKSILQSQELIHEILEKKYWTLAELENEFFFIKKNIFASSPWKLVTNYVLAWMGLNSYDYDGLQPKMTHTPVLYTVGF